MQYLQSEAHKNPKVDALPKKTAYNPFYKDMWKKELKAVTVSQRSLEEIEKG